MKAWIRWPGLIAFVVLVSALFTVAYLFAGGLVKLAVEKTGTRVVGAKVELDNVVVGFSPPGLVLENLQVTNPDEPMRNAVQAGEISLQLDGVALLRRSVIIDEMKVEAVRFNTARTVSGQVKGKPEQETGQVSKPVFAMPDIDLPDVKQILGKEQLESDELADKTRLEMDNTKQKWDENIPRLPGKPAFAAHADKLKSIKVEKTGNKLKDIKAVSDAIDALNKTKKDIKADLDKLVTAEKELRDDIQNLKDNIKAVASAPANDYERLKKKYSPTSSGVANISGLLFGDTAAQLTKTVLDWYEKLAPMLSSIKPGDTMDREVPRHQGVDIHFEQKNRQPSFLIKATRLSMQLEAGDLKGEVKDITSDQAVLGRPLTFRFDADKLKSMKSMEMAGTLDHRDTKKTVDKVKVNVTGYKLSQVALSDAGSFPLMLDKADMNMRIEGRLEQGRLLASLDSGFSSVQISQPEKQGLGSFARTIGNAFRQVRSFDINADLTGTIKEHDINISSTLDDVVKDALGEEFKGKARQFEKDLKAKVEQKTQAKRAELESRLAELERVKNELNSRKAEAQEKIKLVENRIDEFKKQKGGELEDKKKEKLDKLKGLFR